MMPDGDPPLTIRAAKPEDAPAITSIYAPAVLHGTATFELEPPDAAEMRARIAELAAGGFPWLVADVDGSVRGYAYAGPHRERPAYRWTAENAVYIAPDATGQGIGRALLHALIEEAAERGFRQMIAVIGDAANAASIGLHHACGFRHVATLEAVGFKHGRWLATVIMQRALGPGSATEPSGHPTA